MSLTRAPKPKTLQGMEDRLHLVEQWVEASSRHKVQVTRYKEMAQALEVMKTTAPGTHAGYELTFNYHWVQVRRAMLRDPVMAELVKDLEEAERTEEGT